VDVADRFLEPGYPGSPILNIIPPPHRRPMPTEHRGEGSGRSGLGVRVRFAQSAVSVFPRYRPRRRCRVDAYVMLLLVSNRREVYQLAPLTSGSKILLPAKTWEIATRDTSGNLNREMEEQ